MSISTKQLAKLYFDKGMSLAGVSKNTGMSQKRIKTTLIEAGHELRSRSEANSVRHAHDNAKWLKQEEPQGLEEEVVVVGVGGGGDVFEGEEAVDGAARSGRSK